MKEIPFTPCHDAGDDAANSPTSKSPARSVPPNQWLLAVKVPLANDRQSSHGTLILMPHISADQTITYVFRIRKLYLRSILLKSEVDKVRGAQVPQDRARPPTSFPIPRHPMRSGPTLSPMKLWPSVPWPTYGSSQILSGVLPFPVGLNRTFDSS